MDRKDSSKRKVQKYSAPSMNIPRLMKVSSELVCLPSLWYVCICRVFVLFEILSVMVKIFSMQQLSFVHKIQMWAFPKSFKTCSIIPLSSYANYLAYQPF